MEKQFPTIDKVKTGKQIRHLMDSLGLTVMDVQKYMGLATQQAVYHWLNGRSLPSIDNVYALSELFRVPIDKIICGNRGYQPEQRSISINFCYFNDWSINWKRKNRDEELRNFQFIDYIL